MLQLTGICRTGSGDKCGKEAPFRLISPDGLIVPGCFMCREHAEDCVKEYARKLGEHWSIFDVRTDERIDIISENLLTKIKTPVDPLQEALDALEGLVAVQNGPPLIREQAAWATALNNAHDVLAKHARSWNHECWTPSDSDHNEAQT